MIFELVRGPKVPPTPRSGAGFDCELPEDALHELRRPKRRILLPPIPPTKRSWLDYAPSWPSAAMLGICGLFFAIALAAIASWSANKQVKSDSPAPTLVQPTPAIVPTPAPVQQPRTTVPTPRTRLASVRVRRATLYRLPSQEVGVYKWYRLPEEWGGGAVFARYMGTKERFSQIPPNPVPGDMWNVTETQNSWVYCFPLGYSHPIWVDP
jgi:hypothetical protein